MNNQILSFVITNHHFIWIDTDIIDVPFESVNHTTIAMCSNFHPLFCGIGFLVRFAIVILHNYSIENSTTGLSLYKV